MNKMNIPAPFRVDLPTPPLPTLVLASPVPPPPPPVDTRTNTEDVSSSESEMESSDEVFSCFQILLFMICLIFAVKP